MRYAQTLTTTALCLLSSCLVPSSSVGPDPGPTELDPPAEASFREVTEADADPYAHFPWTNAFRREAALLANEVTIEGPKGLLGHAVVAQDDARLVQTAETTPDGFVQTTEIRVASDFTDPIRAQLDAMQIMALRRITLIERPGAVDVRLVAHGDTYYRELSTGKHRRGASLTLDGPIERP